MNVKRLHPSVIKEAMLKNEARVKNGLRPIKIMVRTCILCNQYFESAGNRTCGCKTEEK